MNTADTLAADNIERVLSTMSLFNLIRWNKFTNSYSLSPLIRDWIKTKAERDKSRDRSAQAACAVVSSALSQRSPTRPTSPENTQCTPAEFFFERKTLPYIVACYRYTEFLDKDDIDWLIMGNACRRQGLFDEASGFYQFGGAMRLDDLKIPIPLLEPLDAIELFDPADLLDDLRCAERIHGPNHLFTLELSHHLSEVYQKNGHHSEAEAFIRRTWVARDRILGPCHPLVIEPAEILGRLLLDQGDYEQADHLYQASYSTVTETLGRDHPSSLRLLEEIAVLRASERRYEEADKIYNQLLPRMVTRLGPEDLVLLRAKKNWALCKKLWEESHDSTTTQLLIEGPEHIV